MRCSYVLLSTANVTIMTAANADEGGQKLLSPDCCWRCNIVPSLWKTMWQFLEQTKKPSKHTPTIGRIHLREINTCVDTTICPLIYSWQPNPGTNPDVLQSKLWSFLPWLILTNKNDGHTQQSGWFLIDSGAKPSRVHSVEHDLLQRGRQD